MRTETCFKIRSLRGEVVVGSEALNDMEGGTNLYQILQGFGGTLDISSSQGVQKQTEMLI